MRRSSLIALSLVVVWIGGCVSSPPEPKVSKGDKLGLALFRLAQIDRYLTPDDIEQKLPIDHKLFVPKNPYPPMVDWRYTARVDGPVRPIITMVRFLGPEFGGGGAQALGVGWTDCTDIDTLARITGLKPHYVDLPQVFDIPAMSMVTFVVKTPHMESEVVGHGKNCISEFSVVKRPITASPAVTP